MSEGLSQNSVNCMVQDADGFLWLGTQDGLCRFDGSRFKIFRHSQNDTTTLSDNFVTSIATDSGGRLWVGSRHGLNLRQGSRFRSFFTLPEGRNGFHETVNQISSSNGELLFTTLTVNHLNTETFAVRHPAEMPVLLAFCRVKTDLYLAVGGNKIYSYTNGKLVLTDSLNLSTAGAIRCGFYYQNQLLMGCDNGLLSYHPTTRQTKLLKPWPGVQAFAFNELSGQLWVGTAAGIFVLKDGVELSHITTQDGLSSNHISCLKHAGNRVWAGTFDAGLNQIDLDAGVFNATAATNPHSFLQHARETYFVAGGAVWHHGEKPTLFFAGVKDISAIAFDQEGYLWAGTKDNGVYVLKGRKQVRHFTHLNPSQPGGNRVFYLLPDRAGRMWIATEWGLFRVNADKSVSPFLPEGTPGSISHNYIIHLHETPAGEIVASTATGLNIYHPEKNKFEVYKNNAADPASLAYNIVLCSYTDSKGRLWAGTKGGGLSLIDRKTHACINYSMAQGLPNDYVHGILEDKRGQLWLATGQGLCVFNADNGGMFTFYKNSGLPSNEFGTNSSTRVGNQLFFGGPEGYTHFNPELAYRAFTKPQMVLAGIRENYTHDLPWWPREEKEPLALPYTSISLAFDFAEINFTDPGYARMMYRLRGFDEEWQTCNPAFPTANYTNLPYGHYTLEYGIGPVKKSLHIHIATPFWQQGWFIVLMVALLLGLLVLAVRYLSQLQLRRRLREAELKQKIQGERERISRELHDNIGSHLTVMISSLDNLSYRSEKRNDRETAGKIDGLSDFARNTMQQLRETIWALNKDEVYTDEWSQKVQDYLSRLSENTSISLSFQNRVMSPLPLKSAQAINLFRIMQEAVNNALKHAEPDSIAIFLDVKDNGLRLSITDNGKGFETGTQTEGHFGLGNMQQRAAEISAELHIKSQPGRGTAISCTLK